MGLFSNSTPKLYGPLKSMSPPLGLNPTFCVDHETTLIIKTPTMSHNYEVTDTNGSVIVLCQSAMMSSKQKFQHPRTGQTLFKLRSKTFSRSLWGVDPTGKDIFQVREKNGFLAGKTKITIRFINASDSTPTELVLQPGNRSDSRAELLHGEATIGWISKGSKFFTSTPFIMAVAPGVDLAFMSAICIAYAIFLARRRSSANGANAAGAASGGGGGGAGCC